MARVGRLFRHQCGSLQGLRRQVYHSNQLRLAFSWLAEALNSSAAHRCGDVRLRVSCFMGVPTHTATPSAPALEGLEPSKVWGFFECLTQLPRPSKHEQKVKEWLHCFAKERGLACQEDAVGNVIIKRPGSGGGEHAQAVIIQGHIDMVTESHKHVAHNFMTDPIRLKREGDWITADGTTLGADNGCGVAAALSLLDMPTTEKLPPLECLFTIDEEAGMSGAIGLDVSLLSGRVMLNLDTEDWGDIFIGCAGGGDSEVTRSMKLQKAPEGHVFLELVVDGLLGGHSGIDIIQYGGNAVKMCATAYEAVRKDVPGVLLVEMNGGNKSNAIPRECRARLLVPGPSQADAERAVAQQLVAFQEQYSRHEPALHVCLLPVTCAAYPDAVLDPRDTGALLGIILLLPHGVWKMSHAVPGLVETSNNVASVGPVASSDDGQQAVEYHVVCCTRSSYASGLHDVRQQIQRVADVSNATCVPQPTYPGWAPDPSAKIVKLTQDVIQGITKREAKVGAIHAGLECGVIGEKIPGIQMVSYGPTIKGAHSPDERVQISTLKPFWEATLTILQRIADNKL